MCSQQILLSLPCPLSEQILYRILAWQQVIYADTEIPGWLADQLIKLLGSPQQITITFIQLEWIRILAPWPTGIDLQLNLFSVFGHGSLLFPGCRENLFTLVTKQLVSQLPLGP